MSIQKNIKDSKNVSPIKPRPSEIKPFSGGVYTNYFFTFFFFTYIIIQFAVAGFPYNSVLLTYVALGYLVISVVIDRYLKHDRIVHHARLFDATYMQPYFLDAENIKPAVESENKKDAVRPFKFEEKKKDLIDAVNNISNNPEWWTEYKVLHIDQMFIDFYNHEDLISNAQSSLEELEEYAGSDYYEYKSNTYTNWKFKIDEAIEEIHEVKDEIKEKLYTIESKIKLYDSGEKLRSQLRVLKDHLAEYYFFWADGSKKYRNLMQVGSISIPILLISGILPVLHPHGEIELKMLNWGILGICGSLSATMLNIRKSDSVEIGNTEGEQLIRRTMLGAVLGLVAGVLTYGLVFGSLIEGTIVPDIYYEGINEVKYVGLSVIWAFAAGFSFERIFDRVRSLAYGGI